MSRKGTSDSFKLTETSQARSLPYEPASSSLHSAMKPEKSSKVLCYIGIATTIAILALILAMAALILVVIAFRDISQQQAQPQSQTDAGTQDIQALQSQLNSYGQQIESLQSQLNNYNQITQAQITNFNQALQSQLTSHNQQIQELDEASLALQSQYSDSQQEIQRLQSEQTSYHQESQAIQAQIQQISRSRLHMKTTIVDLVSPFIPHADETAGRPGPVGPPGPAGPTRGGVVYTRWGSSNCSDVNGTELIYSGRAGGSAYYQSANILCMPEDPEHTLPFRHGYQADIPFYMVSYPTASMSQQNSLCAVCIATTRETVLMIPAKSSCPSSWTREYEGYLMAGSSSYTRKFMCVDQEISPINPPATYTLFGYTENDCSNGLPCPPYTSEKELNCVVCTK